MQKNKSKSKKMKSILIVVVVVAVIFAGYMYMTKPKPVDVSIDMSAMNQAQYVVQKSNIAVSVSGSGSVNPTDKRSIKSESDATVDSILVKEGDLVEKDQMLISLRSDSSNTDKTQINDIKLNIEQAQKELNDLYESKNDLNIYAEESGVVSDISLKVGDSISANYKICTIKDTEYSYSEVYFSSADFDKINVGDKASIFLTAFLSTEEGEVDSKDSTPIQLNGGSFGYKATVKIKNPGGLSHGESTQVTVTNSLGSFKGMQNGSIVESKQESIYSKLSGKVSSVGAENGKYINKGDVVLTIEGVDIEFEISQKKNTIDKNNTQLEDLMQGDTVYAPMTGTILQVGVSDEEVVDRNAVLITIADLENMNVVLSVDELDITKIELGQTASITCDTFKDESFTGKVSKISMEGKNENGVTTYDITVKLDDRKTLMSGMNVDIEIMGDKRDNVIAVPIEALNKANGEYTVTVKDESGKESEVKVETGLATNDNVEITSGLKEGDVVCYTKVKNTQSMSTNGSMVMMSAPRGR